MLATTRNLCTFYLYGKFQDSASQIGEARNEEIVVPFLISHLNHPILDKTGNLRFATLMEELPVELCLKIFCFLDYQNLSTAQQVCRKWKVLGSDNILWANLFKERWGEDRAVFYTPTDSKSWKDVYIVQDRCDRVGLGLMIIREGADYYVIYRGEIQSYLGSRRQRKGQEASTLSRQGELAQEGSLVGGPNYGILESILFFIGDLEVASNKAKQSRLM